MLPTLFCPKCNAFIGPTAPTCRHCHWQRPENSGQGAAVSGQPLWTTHLDAPVLGRLAVASDLIIFGYGEGYDYGGAAAFDLHSGQLRWKRDVSSRVVGGLRVDGEQVFFGSADEIVCCRLQDGEILWRSPLPDGTSTLPLVTEARIYVGRDRGGQIYAFDRRSGETLPGWPQTLPQVKRPVHLAWLRGHLVAVSKDGCIYILDVSSRHPGIRKVIKRCERPTAPTKEEERLTAPAAGEDRLYIGSDAGRIFTLDHVENLKTLAEGLPKIIAPPVYADGRLYVGTFVRSLHALDAHTGQQIWVQENFPHSISSAPLVWQGLVFAIINGDGLRVFDAETGEAVWHFPIENWRRGLATSPVMLPNGSVAFGTDGGKICALPWHLGQYDRAAEHQYRRKKFLDAAKLFVLAATTISTRPQTRQEWYKRAGNSWRHLGQPEWAARLWEALGKEYEAAQDYERAAEFQRGRNNWQAAGFFYKASRLYWRVDNAQEKADQCAVSAAKLGRWPLLRLKPRNVPRMTQGKPAIIQIRVENIGYAPADRLKLSLGGSLLRPVDAQILDPLPQDSHFDVLLEVIPTKASDTLSLEALYNNAASPHLHPFKTPVLHIPIDAVKPPHKIKIGDSIQGKVKIVNPDNEPVEFEMGDNIHTEVEVVLGSSDTNHSMAPCPDCGHLNPHNAKFCDACGIKLSTIPMEE